MPARTVSRSALRVAALLAAVILAIAPTVDIEDVSPDRRERFSIGLRG